MSAISDSVSVPEPSAVEIREEHIAYERSVRGIALLYFIAASGCGLMAIGLLLVSLLHIGTTKLLPTSIFAIAIILALATFHCWVGFGIRRLRPWARTTAIAVAFFQLFAVPIGTIIGLYIIYLLTNQKWKLVFSARYQEIIEQTPSVRYRTPVHLWIALGILLAVVLGLIGYVVLDLTKSTRL
jgi:hypothetical protein